MCGFRPNHHHKVKFVLKTFVLSKLDPIQFIKHVLCCTHFTLSVVVLACHIILAEFVNVLSITWD